MDANYEWQAPLRKKSKAKEFRAQAKAALKGRRFAAAAAFLLAAFFGVDELVVLGKGVSHETGPQTIEARIVSGGMDKMTKDQREQVLAVVKAMFANHPELFEEGESNATGL